MTRRLPDATKPAVDQPAGFCILGRITRPGVTKRLLAHDVTRRALKHLQQVIESDHFRLQQMMPKVGCLRSFVMARRTIAGFEALLWLRKGFGFAGTWTVRGQNELLALRFGLQKVNEA